ncbi:helix-turn-helix domain-containing protein [Streptomyces mayteni]
MASPTIQRRRLGIALKRARERAGKTQDEAAVLIDAASSKVSRMEIGQNGIKLTDLNVLLDFYGVTGEQADWMRDLARSGRQRGRWSGYRNVIPDWFRQYLDLEEDATEIRWYQAELVPGILQTEAYVRALHVTAPQFKDGDLDRQIRVRMERVGIVDRPDAPQVNFILSESALRRNVGGPQVMREQREFLANVAQRPNVQLQILPFDSESYETATFGFTVLRFDHDASTDVVYLEDYMDANYLDRPDAVRAYSALWDRLQAAALGPVESRRLILRVADER